MSRIARRVIPVVLLLTGLLAAQHAHAETRIIPGGQLTLSTSSPQDLVIGTDPSLHGQLRFSSDSSLSCLAITGTDSVVVSTSRCGEDSATLRIDIAPDAKLTLASSGNGDIRVANLHGPLTVSLSGSGDLVTGSTGPLTLSVRASGDATLGDVNGPAVIDMNGNGDVRLKAVRGPLTVRQMGAGDLVAGAIQGDVVLDGNGSGDILLGAGHIENLQAHMNGSGDLSVAAAIRDGTVDMRGGGDAKLGPVSGALNQNAADGSGIVVLDADHAKALDNQAARKIGSGDGRTHNSIQFGSHATADLESFLTFAFAVLVLYIGWRIMRRAGGLSGLRRNWRSGGVTPPSNPAVLALGETMTRLEQRLGRLESYVTTREFDLARKFREMGP